MLAGHERGGPISAYAEEPRCRRVGRPSSRAYLRVSGGTSTVHRSSCSTRAYLRVRGGTGSGECFGLAACGLSPRTRRNRRARRQCAGRRGPISAYAEEPWTGRPSRCGVRAYLRVRGGTVERSHVELDPVGLSPRKRRNLRSDALQDAQCGPISAYAEEPARPSGRAAETEAYLRVRGGTALPGGANLVRTGLPPRTRRNREVVKTREPDKRPISAYAEERGFVHHERHNYGAYLRVPGGTEIDKWHAAMEHGLSPRTRRNQNRRRAAHRRAGPISAYAEEPAFAISWRFAARAYLRVRGGTSRIAERRAISLGLSPRTRRNPNRSE